ncbi:MAG: NUDIX hydrolase [candidate division TM6 bacterium GW2011_GWE2_41_16]|nr:MAG: NUDIX hydrolase [candidate division TM6 bacterium GW2011_GWE2_41_16]
MAERYLQAVSVMLIFKRGGRILLEQRSPKSNWFPNGFAIPGGGVDEGETILAAAVREAREELGVGIDPKNLRIVHVMHRGPKLVSPKLAQQAVLFFVEVLDWQGEPYIAEQGKAQQLIWFAPQDIPQPVVPYVAQVLDCIAQGDLYSEWSW